MSTNCVICVKNKRTGMDLLCDECREPELTCNIIFSLDDKQMEEFKEWKRKHDKDCELADGKDGAIGGRISFKFTPTSLSTIIKVKCACNSSDSELDLSHLEDW